MKSPWSNAYSKNGDHHYQFEDPQDVGLVCLCDACSREELDAGRVSFIMY